MVEKLLLFEESMNYKQNIQLRGKKIKLARPL